MGSVGEADVEPQSFENGVRRHFNACVNVLNSLPPWGARVSRQDSWPDRCRVVTDTISVPADCSAGVALAGCVLLRGVASVA